MSARLLLIALFVAACVPGCGGSGSGGDRAAGRLPDGDDPVCPERLSEVAVPGGFAFDNLRAVELDLSVAMPPGALPAVVRVTRGDASSAAPALVIHAGAASPAGNYRATILLPASTTEIGLWVDVDGSSLHRVVAVADGVVAGSF